MVENIGKIPYEVLIIILNANDNGLYTLTSKFNGYL